MQTFHHYFTKKVSMLLPLCFFTFLPLQAQTFTQRVQTSAKGEGKVTIHQDPAIDELVNASGIAPKKNTATQQPADKNAAVQPAKTGEHNDKAEKPEKNNKNEKPAATNEKPEKHEKTDSVEFTTPRRTRKIMGYRVQAFAGGNSRKDRQKAEQTANAILALFPGEAVYTHFYSPRWICRVGNYPTYEEARRMLVELRKLGYSSATIVKGKITVPY